MRQSNKETRTTSLRRRESLLSEDDFHFSTGFVGAFTINHLTCMHLQISDKVIKICDIHVKYPSFIRHIHNYPLP